jgi:hypothetical protein
MPLTVPEIRLTLSHAGKKISRETLYVYFRRYNIKPIGDRQCPQQFPDNAPDQILLKLGLKPSRNGQRKLSRRTTRR